MDEAGLFGPRNDLGLDPGVALDRGEKFAAVFRFPDGAGRRREDFFHLVGLSQPSKAPKRLEGPRHRLCGERLAAQSA
jgi:hypothetical protein